MIVIVEDDSSIRELVCYTLNNSGLEAVGFSQWDSFYEYLKGETPRLILLDIMLPQKDGITILKELRARDNTKEIPIIMLTAKNTEYDKVIGLDSGADDYITKPFGMMELVSRVKAILRRNQGEKQTKTFYSIGDLIIDDVAHIVKCAGKETELTLKEYLLLKLLVENKGKVMTRDIILQKIWGYDFDGETRTVDVHVRTLRTKLNSCGDYIETVRGVGYKVGEDK